MSQSLPKLLLVDDEERFRTTMSKRLNEKGYEVADVGSGMEALDYIRSHPVDVVILDIKMPGLSGVETLAEIQKLGLGIEVLLLTGHATVPTAIEGMRLGAHDYLMKPCEFDHLVQKIDEAAKIRRERQERLRKAEERALLDKMEKRWTR
ncbi:MAG: response regulator [Desulfobacterales bacterium]|nr:response regulator [Desulfobacterales bacterium]